MLYKKWHEMSRINEKINERVNGRNGVICIHGGSQQDFNVTKMLAKTENEESLWMSP